MSHLLQIFLLYKYFSSYLQNLAWQLSFAQQSIKGKFGSPIFKISLNGNSNSCLLLSNQ